MGQYHLKNMFNPRHIAVVGASKKKGTIGHALMTNLIDGGFAGKILPVNPKYKTLQDHDCVKSVRDLMPGVDLAIIATPIHTAIDIVTDCVEKKMRSAIIISAGGREVGDQGRKIEDQIQKIAYDGGLRILGPNCMGLIRPGVNLNAGFASDMPRAGNLAVVSQSGAICGAILDMAAKERMGFSHFVSIGSMLDIDFGDMIDYLGNDSSAKSILLYIENLTHVRKFMSAARSVSRVKPIIVLKSGRSPAGEKAAASHTGAMAGEDAVYDAAFKRAGIVRVDSIEELFDCAELMAKQPRPRGPRLAILTNGGGPGVMAADTLAGYGKAPEPLDPETIQALDAFLPPFWSRGNPIDILGDATADRFGQALSACFKSKNLDGVLVIFAPQAIADPLPVAKMLASAVSGREYPVFACWMGGESIEKSVAVLNDAGVPTYDTPERAVRSFLYMVEYAANLETLIEVPPKMTRNMEFDQKKARNLMDGVQEGFMPEADAVEMLTAYGLPVITTKTAETEAQALRMAGEIGFPLVMKLLSPDITHKTDAGGICLDLRSNEDVSRAYQQIMSSVLQYKPDAEIEGVTLQPYFSNPDFEILMGAKRDKGFGPVILFGMGGIFTEVLKDRSLGLPPMNRLLASRLMRETRVYTLLKGYRNRPAADMEKLEEMIIRLSQLLIDFPQIAELDMNPVLIKDGSPVAVDARIRISPTDVCSSLHLVISPYPEEDESLMRSTDGLKIFIRPVKPEDAPLFTALFKTLTPTTIYYRFFGALKGLNPELLARFTQIDYDREIALVALDETAQTEDSMLGVARIIGEPDGKTGEFSVLVRDAWQGKGIGSSLLERCLAIARKQGYETVHGIVLRENRNMLALGKKLGFEIEKDPDSCDCNLVIHFGKQNLKPEGLFH